MQNRKVFIMKELVVSCAMFASAAFAAVPVIDAESVTVRQDRGHTVVIEYTLNPAAEGDSEPAIVTVDILTNAVGGVAASVGAEHLQTLSGDVNRIVGHTADGKHKILWKPHREGMPEFTLPAVQVSAQITVWSTNSPPDYWVVDLTQPADRSADRYYPSAGQVPLGVTNIIYKTDRLVFRRISAQGVTWKMGGADNENNPLHYVTFSYDYWMAIYELTERQHNKLGGSYADADVDGPFPMGRRFDSWRGAPDNDSVCKWPQHGHASVDGWMANARGLLGGIMVDLPTRAEWEFACRAGSSTKYCNGDTEADLAKVAWYLGNAEGVVHEVGTREPNAWGMYDMHGNRAEWTLDRCAKMSSDPVWDPVGPREDDATVTWVNTSTAMALCGGGQQNEKTEYKNAYWFADTCTSDYGTAKMKKQILQGGARLVIPLD